MTLLRAPHRDPESAALAVAANRASKCELLRRDAAGAVGGKQLREMAENNALRLEADVLQWLAYTAAGKRASSQTRRALRESIDRAYGDGN